MSLPRADNQWFAVLASDGLWDVFSNQEAADMILEAMLTVATPPLGQRCALRWGETCVHWQACDGERKIFPESRAVS